MNNPDLSAADAAMIEKRMQLVEVEQAATYLLIRSISYSELQTKWCRTVFLLV